MERASGSVSESCSSGALTICLPSCFSRRICLDCLDLLLQMLHSRLGHRARITIRPIQIRQVAGDTLLELLHPCPELVLGEVPIPAVDPLELAAIDRHERIGEQVQATAQELPAHPPNGQAVVLAEIRNGLEV